MADAVNIRGAFEAQALQVLRKIPGLEVTTEATWDGRQIDAIFSFPGGEARLAVETKARANAATAWQLVHYAQEYPQTRLLLIAGETTAEARKILADHGIAVIDGLGNAHIAVPGLLVHLEGRHRGGIGQAVQPSTTRRRTRLNGKAGVAAQVLLIHPDRAWHVDELASEAKVSPALAHHVLERLEREGIAKSEGNGPNQVRHLTNPGALLDLWAEENVQRPTRTRAYLLARTPQQLIDTLGREFARSGLDYAFTGAAGAMLVAPFVTAMPVAEVWVPATAAPEELYKGAQVEPVAEGHNVVFLQAKDDTPLAFREETSGLWVANKFRLYADLLRNPRRGREQAEHLREEVIGF